MITLAAMAAVFATMLSLSSGATVFCYPSSSRLVHFDHHSRAGDAITTEYGDLGWGNWRFAKQPASGKPGIIPASSPKYARTIDPTSNATVSAGPYGMESAVVIRSLYLACADAATHAPTACTVLVSSNPSCGDSSMTLNYVPDSNTTAHMELMELSDVNSCGSAMNSPENTYTFSVQEPSDGSAWLYIDSVEVSEDGFYIPPGGSCSM